MANTIYQTKATVTGGRNGHVKSEDGVLNIDLRIPKEMGGPGGAYSNPEQLFAAGYAACFDSALNFVAAQQKIRLNGSAVTATVGLQKQDPGFKLEVHLDVTIPELDRAEAQKLLETAHQVCPYSNALRNNVDVTLTLV
ncbi:organic hydroperoxide resistance protein [Chitinophaga sp. Cy-1792]|uniref:organic hydroperoxide resistance protein n=1 Tax=Chitinophaga sp. Cy-1792 TaxID=2608339 RepID=UPI001421978C|nr:organic hydroperoxide resistance protein [Chitinophaga sp. Cy-1792]NIG54108.1 organic hydroperoxide resistance protein [Chitinophaga sp. Cy-1792]